MNNKTKVIVTRRWPEAVESKLADKFDVTFNDEDRPFTQSQFRAALSESDALLTTVTDKVDAAVFEGIPESEIRTKIIGNYGVGFSHIDIKAARSKRILVTNTPDVLSECTADIAMMLMLMVARRAGEGERELRSGNWAGWRPTHLIGSRVTGSTLGIVGFGRIGRETAKRARGFGMNIMVYGRSDIDPMMLSKYDAVQARTLEQLMQKSDFVSLHCPGGKENTHLIDSRMLDLMKPTAFLINTARGEVVDEQALTEHLKSGSIAGAGLDVYHNEPLVNPDLLQCPNAVLLPHLGSATSSTREEMGFRVLQNIQQYFQGQRPTDCVN